MGKQIALRGLRGPTFGGSGRQIQRSSVSISSQQDSNSSVFAARRPPGQRQFGPLVTHESVSDGAAVTDQQTGLEQQSRKLQADQAGRGAQLLALALPRRLPAVASTPGRTRWAAPIDRGGRSP